MSGETLHSGREQHGRGESCGEGCDFSITAGVQWGIPVDAPHCGCRHCPADLRGCTFPRPLRGGFPASMFLCVLSNPCVLASPLAPWIEAPGRWPGSALSITRDTSLRAPASGAAP